MALAAVLSGQVLAAPSQSPSPSPSPSPAAADNSLLTFNGLSAAQLSAPVVPKAKGAHVLRAQVLLDRAHYASGEIDAAFGSNLRQAIIGFQKLKQLPLSGVVDAATWALLAADQAPILASYVLSAQDVAGPYVPVPAGMAAKSKLSALGYGSLLEALGERFHCSPALLRRLNPGKTLSRGGEEILVPNVAAAAPLPKAAKILVDSVEGTLTLLDAGGTPFAQFPASTGSAHDPLPSGQWQVRAVAMRPVYQYNPKLFWDAKPGELAAKIEAGPNNPVGVVWIELSKRHYGIHGTPEPANIGKTQSHGCIRLTNWDALAVAKSISAGVVVLLQE
ncbi:Lipoprotein-anchoring transpeptidase ErfK/SrfK [Rugamonas rubra]|uniref:Lipoprotein-anchoring transpeptidase ErfK/SrfK n=2 Tax=Rugamonas rubra TaxID=758825 RepID=A0A1I4RHT6_9BURK|nr:Lipoprotein-anchoring transpeptidase ErfK/SrfK [Rugamonas rubra]